MSLQVADRAGSNTRIWPVSTVYEPPSIVTPGDEAEYNGVFCSVEDAQDMEGFESYVYNDAGQIVGALVHEDTEPANE